MTMDPKTSDVKRPYDVSGRRLRAEQTRRAIVDAARELLLSEGYAGTTVVRVAAACQVSVESVYKRFAGKPELVRAVVENALEGDGPTPAEERSDALTATDALTLLRGWARLTVEVAPRVAPVLLLVRDAAALDPALTALAASLDAARRSRMATNARRLVRIGGLRPGVRTAEVADVLWTFSSPELYDLLVRRRGWPVTRYGDFVARGLVAQLAATS